jgi:uncharacterized membrane protein
MTPIRIIKMVLPLLLLSPTAAFAEGQSGGIDVAKNFAVLFDLSGLIAGVIGFFLLASGLYGLFTWAKTGGQGKTAGSSILSMLIGTVLASVGWFYQLIKTSFIGDNSNGVTISDSGAYNLALDTAALQAAQAINQSGFGKFIPEGTLKAVLAFVFFVGFVAFISGVYSLKDVTENRGSQHPILMPVVKIIGGAICMNITWFSCLVAGTLNLPALCAGG